MTSFIVRVQQWLGHRLAGLRADERGAITTETAVVTFILITLAIAIGAAITLYATGVVESFPDP